jgi:hypothetical protein
MHFAVPQDTLRQDTPQADRSADRPEPSAAKQRASATAILLAMALCAVAMKTQMIETPGPASHQAAQNSDVTTAPVKIIAPEFCKDQTWPYIDSRCLRRVDNPAAPATQPRIVTPPANTAAAASAPNDAIVNNNVSASSASAAAEPAAAADQDRGEAQAAPASPSASATSPADPRAQVIQSVFPTTAPGAASESGVARSDVASYQHTSDGSQRHRQWNRYSNFFGFHF